MSCKKIADAKHACLIVKNYDSLTERMSCIIFADVKHACLIIKNNDSLTEHSANILCDAKCNMPSSNRGPLANLRFCILVLDFTVKVLCIHEIIIDFRVPWVLITGYVSCHFFLCVVWSLWLPQKKMLHKFCSLPVFLGQYIHAPRSFHRMLFLSNLIILPMYPFFLLIMKVLILGMLLKWFLTSLFIILSSLTHSPLSPSILLIALWWKPLSLLMFLAVMFHDLHPQGECWGALRYTPNTWHGDQLLYKQKNVSRVPFEL